MKKALISAVSAVIIASVVALTGCSGPQIQAASANVSAVNSAAIGALQTTATSIATACPVGQAVVTSAAAVDPSLTVVALGNGVFCAVNKAIAATTPVAASGVK